LLKPNFVKILSGKFPSCDITFSVIKRILPLYFRLIKVEIEKWHNEKKGCHQSNTIRSAFSLFSFPATFIQLNKEIELTILSLGISLTSFLLSSNWVLPGKRNEG